MYIVFDQSTVQKLGQVMGLSLSVSPGSQIIII